MRVVVCGGRDWTDSEAVYRELDRLWKEFRFDVLAEGDARGVDRMAGYWARMNKIDNLKFRVDHAIDGPWPAAGPRRNGRMLAQVKPHLVIAFPGGPGTADCIRQATSRAIDVLRVLQ